MVSNCRGADIDIDRLIYSVDGVEIDLYTSNESVGAQAEYIRDGLDYTVWMQNVVKLIESGKFRGVHVMCTINALCLDSLPEFLEQLTELKNIEN